MKNSDRLFKDAERLKPSPALWRRIAERSPLAASGERVYSYWEAPLLRAAAVVALAASVLGLAALGISYRKTGGETGGETTVLAAAPAAVAAGVEAPAAEEEIIDPELLGWQAELGELDLEAEEAGEML